MRITEQIIVIKRYKSFILGICKCGCNKDCSIRTKKGFIRKYINGHNMKGIKGKNHPNWKGGRYVYENKYIRISDSNHIHAYKNGIVLEHIKIFTDFYKCCLLPWADIHHKDGNIHNNHISNLELLSHSKHSVLTHLINYSYIRCFICDSFKTRLRNLKHGMRPLWYNYLHTFICHNCYNKKKKN